MRRRLGSLRLLALAACVACGPSSAFAIWLPWEEADDTPPESTTTYIERSLNGQANLTIEHPKLRARTGDSAAIAGFCRSAGSVRRPTETIGPVTRQREVCENIAPRQLWPGQIGERPTYPADGVSRRGLNFIPGFADAHHTTQGVIRDLKKIKRLKHTRNLEDVVRLDALPPADDE